MTGITRRGSRLTDPIVVKRAETAVTPPAEVRSGNLDCNQAIEAMRAGKIVRRFNGGAAQKFHRIHNSTVETADTASKVVAGDWERAKTDIDSWFNSTFRVVTTMVEIVALGYES